MKLNISSITGPINIIDGSNYYIITQAFERYIVCVNWSVSY